MKSPTIQFYTNNLPAPYLVAEFTLKFDTGLGWVHAVSGSLNRMSGNEVKARWPLTHKGGRFSNCPDGVAEAPAADGWIKARFLEFLAERRGLGGEILSPEELTYIVNTAAKVEGPGWEP